MKKIRKRTVIRALLYVFGIFLLLNSSVLFFISNIHTGVFAEFIFGAAFLLCGVFFEGFTHKTPVWLKFTCVAIVAAVCAATLFLLSHGASDTAKCDEDVLIVLGAGVHGTEVGENLRRRLDSAVSYREKNPQVLIVVSGGMGPQEEITEAQAMEEYLISRGVPKENILKEDKASSTYENFTFSKKLLDERFGEKYTASFVTNEFHIYRAHGIAKRAGFKRITHIHARTNAFTVISNCMRECLAVAKFALTGR